MGRIEDLKETAPCGMEIHYTVDENDMRRLHMARNLQTGTAGKDNEPSDLR